MKPRCVILVVYLNLLRKWRKGIETSMAYKITQVWSDQIPISQSRACCEMHYQKKCECRNEHKVYKDSFCYGGSHLWMFDCRAKWSMRKGSYVWMCLPLPTPWWLVPKTDSWPSGTWTPVILSAVCQVCKGLLSPMGGYDVFTWLYACVCAYGHFWSCQQYVRFVRVFCLLWGVWCVHLVVCLRVCLWALLILSAVCQVCKGLLSPMGGMMCSLGCMLACLPIGTSDLVSSMVFCLLWAVWCVHLVVCLRVCLWALLILSVVCPVCKGLLSPSMGYGMFTWLYACVSAYGHFWSCQQSLRYVLVFCLCV